MTTKYTNDQNIPNDNKINQIVINIRNGHKIYQHFPLQGPQKYTQIGIFGTLKNDLATLSEEKSRYQIHAVKCYRNFQCFPVSIITSYKVRNSTPLRKT
jgi:hypothetical protein